MMKDIQNIIAVEVGNGIGEVLDMSSQMSYEDIEVRKTMCPSFSSLVLKEEKAECTDEEMAAFSKMQELGFFSPIYGMANIRQVFNDRLYAQVYVDEELNRTVEFCQQYRDGNFSPVIKLPQSEMRIAARTHFESKEIKEPALRNEVAKFVVKTHKDYYGKTPCGEELNVLEVLNVLYYVMPQLPVKRAVSKVLDRKAFYRLLMLYVDTYDMYPMCKQKSYYLLDAEGIEQLACKMGMKRLELLRQLDKYNFLYRTESSEGYQTNVRLKGYDGKSFTEWFYCIYKLKFFAGFEEKEQKFDF